MFSDANRFAGRCAFVTGGTRGIGRSTVRRLAASGARVVAAGRDLPCLNNLHDEIGCRVVALDLRDVEATRAAIRNAGPIDLLVNCAGIVNLAPILDVTAAMFDEVMAVNVRAALILGQEVARNLIARGQNGAIVNVSSTASCLGQLEHTAYGASKGALDSLTRAMAVEFGVHGIRTNAVNPTVTMTEMAAQAWSDPERSGALLARIPLGRFAQPDEVAAAILYLLSDEASMINGVTLRVDGGHLIT